MFNVSLDDSMRYGDAYGNAVLAAALVYGFLTVFGIFGNCLVIFVIIRVLFCSTGFLQVYIYTLSLSLVDLAFFLSAPFIIINMVAGEWLFDVGICKLMFICEGLNKGLSVYLLTVLTGDRFLAVCYPLRSQNYRTSRASLLAVLVCCAFVVLANAPLYIYSELTELSNPIAPNETIKLCLIRFPLFSTANSSLSTLSPNNETYEDPHGDIWDRFETYYTLFMLAFYHVIPGALIVGFSCLIHLKMRHSMKKLHKRSSKKGRVTKSIFSVVIFYFVCWTPFWVLQIFIVFLGPLDNRRQEIIYIAVVLYGLPYLNSAVNPLLYTFLNKNLRKTYGNTKDLGKRRAAVRQDRFTNASGLNNTELDFNTVSCHKRSQPAVEETCSFASADMSATESFTSYSLPPTHKGSEPQTVARSITRLAAALVSQHRNFWSHSVNGHVTSQLHTLTDHKEKIIILHRSQTL